MISRGGATSLIMLAQFLAGGALGQAMGVSPFDSAFNRLLISVRWRSGPQPRVASLPTALRNCQRLNAKLRLKEPDELWLACFLAGRFRLACCGHQIIRLAASPGNPSTLRLIALKSLGLIRFIPSTGLLHELLTAPYNVLTGPAATAWSRISPSQARRQNLDAAAQRLRTMARSAGSRTPCASQGRGPRNVSGEAHLPPPIGIDAKADPEREWRHSQS